MIVLIPEIGLAAPLVKQFKDRLGDCVSVIHSGLSDKERTEEWEKIVTGKSLIVLGTRVAIFAPVKNLKVLIVDEEYETTYKQDQNPKYDARTVAGYLTKNWGVVTILGSATPSIEAFYKAQTGSIKLLKLSQRLESSSPAPIEVIDMREKKYKLL